MRVGDLRQLIARQLTTDDAAAHRLSDRLTPVLSLHDLLLPWLSDSYLIRRWFGYAYQAAVAAEYGLVDITNPAGSGELGVIEKISVQKAAAGSVRIKYYEGAAPGTPETEGMHYQDLRLWRDGKDPVLTSGDTTLAALVDPDFSFRVAAGALTTLDVQIILPAGTAVAIYDETANEDFWVQTQGFELNAPGFGR